MIQKACDAPGVSEPSLQIRHLGVSNSLGRCTGYCRQSPKAKIDPSPERLDESVLIDIGGFFDSSVDDPQRSDSAGIRVIERQIRTAIQGRHKPSRGWPPRLLCRHPFFPTGQDHMVLLGQPLQNGSESDPRRRAFHRATKSDDLLIDRDIPRREFIEPS
jgi:hypothetical protein